MTSLYRGFANLPLLTKSLIAPILVSCFLLALSLLIYRELNTLNQQMHHVAEELAPQTRQAGQILREVQTQRIAIKDYLRNSDKQYIQMFAQSTARSMQSLQNIKATSHGTAREHTINALITAEKNFDETFKKIIVSNTRLRNHYINDTLNVLGPQATGTLSLIMQTAHQNNQDRAAYLAASVLQHLLLARTHVFKFLTTSDTGDVQHVVSELRAARAGLNSLSDALSDHELLGLAANSRDALEKYADAFTKTVAASTTRDQAIQQKLRPIGHGIVKNAEAMLQDITAAQHSASDLAKTEVARTKQRLIILTILASVLGLALAYLITRGIIRPLRRTHALVGEMIQGIERGEGDLSVRFPVHGRDEIGQLTENCNTLVATLYKVIRRIAGATTQVATAAEELSAVTHQTSQGIQRQKSETESVATAMHEMAATVQEVAHSASRASQSASEANAAATAGAQVVEITVAAIHNLAEEVEHTATALERVKNDTRQIDTVLAVIENVAEQTNLLALNAAIEAARAGQQGRGFAVVADEVRNLALRTQQSTEEIRTVIEGLQRGADEAVAAMAQGRTRARQTVEQASEAGTSLAHITTAVSAINDMNATIASASEQQASVAEEVNRNLTIISQITEESASGAGQTATSGVELAKLAEELQQVVRQFRV